jgi:Ser/Thr protein kinase RdoA (MazF antagonist)
VTEISTVGRVAQQFALSAPARSIVPFGRGHINETFLVTTGHDDYVRREYVVQRINGEVFAEPDLLMQNIVTVSQHLAERFMPDLVPGLVSEIGGGWLVREGGDAWRVWDRVPSAEPIDAPTPARVAAAAHLLGRFHAGVADLDPARLHETLPGFHDPRRRLGLLRAAVDADPVGRVSGVRAEIAAAFKGEALVEIAEALVARVPCRVAHNDAKLDNVLFRRDDAVSLVDLDTIMPTAWFWDVGDLVRTASTPVAEDDPHAELAIVDPVLYRAVLDGYRAGVSIASVEPDEMEAVERAGAIVTYEQALRFLTDWIAGDVYYRTVRADQNLDRARNQLALLASMPGTVGS